MIFKPLPRYPYVAMAFTMSGRKVGEWKSKSVAGAMKSAEEAAPRECVLNVRAAWTDDGTFWGPGGGTLVATSDPDSKSRGLRTWRVDRTRDPLTEKSPENFDGKPYGYDRRGKTGLPAHIFEEDDRRIREAEEWYRRGMPED